MDRDQQLQELLRSYGERDRVERNLQNTLNQWFPNPRQNVSRRREQRMAQTRPLQHQCGLCGNEMRLPTTLAVCNHSFCRDCLKDHVNRSVDKRCPLCKQIFDVMPMVNFELKSAIDKSHNRTDSLPAPNSKLPSPNKPPSANPSMEELEEQFQCGVCYELMVLPTSLNCGHSFCRHCLARWYDSSRRMECPACRQAYAGLPKVNIQIKSTIEKFFPEKSAERTSAVLSNPENMEMINKYEQSLRMEQTNAEQHLQNQRTENAINMQGEAVVAIMKNVCTRMLYAVIGTGVALILLYILYMYLHVSEHHRSDDGKVDKKSLELWTVDDVSNWLDELGLADYQQNFVDNKINGKMLFEIAISDLETLIGITNPLHQRMFMHSLGQLRRPITLWDYNSEHDGYPLFLICAMAESSRTVLPFLSWYHPNGFKYYAQVVTGNSGPLEDYQIPNWFYPCFFFLAEWMNMKFIANFFFMHYWLCIFLIVQCAHDVWSWVIVVKQLVQDLVKGPNTVNRLTELCMRIQNSVLAYAILAWKRMGFYFTLSIVWYFLPSFITRTLLLARIFIPGILALFSATAIVIGIFANPIQVNN